MKRNITHILWVAALLLVSCQQEEFPRPDIGKAVSLSITVTDSGYHTDSDAKNPQEPQTRAVESGYNTEFIEGDACGFYLVRVGGLVYENVKLTARRGEGGLIWQADEGVEINGGLHAEAYFLYYPYRENIAGEVNAFAGDDMDFFKQIIDNWQPAADQSDYASYTASDLMTAIGEVIPDAEGKPTLHFSMSHQMALAEIRMPTTRYKFTNTTGTVPDYISSSPVDFSKGDVLPYNFENGVYRYIVRPNGDQVPTIKGRFVVKGLAVDRNKEFVISPNIKPSNYKIYKVDGAPVTEKNHNLQRGDFLLSDGSLVSKDNQLTTRQKAKVSAIVFWSPFETSTEGRFTPARLTDDKIMSTYHPHCTHGLALAIKNVNDGTQWQSEGFVESVSDWQAGAGFSHPMSSDFVSIASLTDTFANINKIYGYQNTVLLRLYNAHCNANGKAKYAVQPIVALDEFEKTNQAPAGSTGWFVPSEKELHILCYKDVDNIMNVFGKSFNDTRIIVNTSLSAAGGDLVENIHWSSSESHKDISNGGAYLMNFEECYAVPVKKSYDGVVRAVCAF